MKSRKLAYVLLIPGVALVLLSVVMNFGFGFTMGQGPLEHWVYGLALASMDVVKAVLPIVIITLMAQNQIGWMISAGLTFFVCTLLSLSSSFSFTALSQASDAGERRVEAQRYQVLNTQLSRAMQARQSLPVTQPPTVLLADMKAMHGHRRWRSTAQCSNATVTPSIVFCEAYQKIAKAHASAAEAARLDASIAKLRQELTTISHKGASGEHPPHLVALGQLVALEPDEMGRVRAVLISIALELTSGLVLVFATMVWPNEPLPPGKRWRLPSFITMRCKRPSAPAIAKEKRPALLPPPASTAGEGSVDVVEMDQLATYVAERLMQVAEGQVTAKEVYADYQQWCVAQGIDPKTQTALGKAIKQAGIGKEKVKGLVRYKGVSLPPAS